MKNTNRDARKIIPFLDFYIILSMFFVALCFLLLLLINPIAEEAKKPKVEFLISMDWEDGSEHDIDIFIKTPKERIIYFNNKSIDFLNLERDDLGVKSDSVTNPDGTITTIRVNREVVTFRGWQEGKYIVNVFAFSMDTPEELEIKTELLSMNPYGIVIAAQNILSRKHDEKTAFSFEIDSEGKVINVDQNTQHKFVLEVIKGVQ